MEMHMVCYNSKYVHMDGSLDDMYLAELDGAAVLGLMFQISDTSKTEVDNLNYLSVKLNATQF